MAKLILSMDNQMIREIPLDRERISIGRKPQNDIQIDNLAISGAHAVVVTILHDSFLEDLDSTNGTFVNGQQIQKHFLQHNDVIELGKYRLKYIKDLNQQLSGEDFEKTMVLRPDTVRKSMEAPPPLEERPRPVPPVSTTATTPVPTPTPVATPTPVPNPTPINDALPLGSIQVLTGSNVGRTLDLVKTLTTLGRPGVQVAVIARRPHGYFLTHVEGERQPRVNGAEIGAQAHPLSDHDIIELAGVKMEFFLK